MFKLKQTMNNFKSLDNKKFPSDLDYTILKKKFLSEKYQ